MDLKIPIKLLVDNNNNGYGILMDIGILTQSNSYLEQEHRLSK